MTLTQSSSSFIDTPSPILSDAHMSRERITNRLGALRQLRDLTQEEVARFMGLDVTTISKQESGLRRLSPAQAESYSKLYRCTILELYIDPTDVYTPE